VRYRKCIFPLDEFDFRYYIPVIKSTGVIEMYTSFLTEARTVRKQLLASSRYSNASIRDAIELAVDHRRQMEYENECDGKMADRDHNDAYGD
jgi:hypothetical protein